MKENGATVRARNLTHAFAEGVGVWEIDLDVDPGTIFGFIGPSGSGKTTTIRLLTGVIAPDAGEITIFGKPRPDSTSPTGPNSGTCPNSRSCTPT